MATAGSLLADVRVQVGDPNGDFLTDTIGFEWLDTAQQRFCHEVLALDEIKDYPLVARQKRYDLPTDCYLPMTVLWYKNSNRKLSWADPAEFEEFEMYHPSSTGYPRGYTVIRRQLVMGPAAPVSNSATALASGTALITATTIGLTAASGTFRTKGFMLNATTGEVVEYTNVATTTITGCTRGVHNTTAASVASNDQWKEIDVQMRYRRSPTVITASTQSPDIPNAFHRYLEHFVMFMVWRARGDKAKADAAYTQFEAEEKRAKDTIGRRAFEPRAIKDRRHSSRGEWGWGDGM